MFALLLALVFQFASVAHAQSDPTVVQTQIDETSIKIAQLQAEIAQLQGQLDTTGKQKQTLQSAVKSLDLNIQKLQKSMTLTQTQITQKDKEISKLSGNITTTSGDISSSKLQVGDSLRQLASIDNEPLSVLLLGGGTLSSFFDAATTLEALRGGLQQRIESLSELKTDLQTSKSTAETKRTELARLKQNLTQQNKSLAIARETQAQLLAQTKNQESVYQAQIAQKKAQQQQFESELADFQSQLNLTTGAIPKTGTGSLSWPVASPYITQYFGNTPFATQNAQVYGGKGHNAIDLRASPGTPILSARTGVVLGTGNTDLTCAGASYGKWVFIKHDNGLSTLYAHLSTISVTQGQSVSTGQVVGYSGSTGYATGPHLHFSVYVSSGSEIASFASKSCKGKTYTMPVANNDAYLNPLSYLPAL